MSISPATTFGQELWDNIPAVEVLTQDGLDTMVKLMDYFKKRALLESDYAKQLQKLDEQFRELAIGKKRSGGGSSKKLNAVETTSFQSCWAHFLDQTEHIAKSHGSVAHYVESDMLVAMKEHVKHAEAQRKKFIQDTKQLKVDLKKHYEQVEKVKKVYDVACRAAEEARLAFEKADKDLNVTKAQVEKLNTDAVQKAKRAEEAAEEYSRTLTQANQKQTSHYQVELPEAIDALEEARLTFLGTEFVRFAEMSLSFNGDISSAYQAIQNSSKMIDPADDSLQFIEQHGSGATLPEPLQFENFYEKNGLRAKRKEKAVEGEEDLNGIPAEKAIKIAMGKIREIERELAETEKKHAGVRTLAEAYLTQPQFADSKTLTEVNMQLDEIEEKADVLRLRKYKYEAFIAARTRSDQPAVPVLFADSRTPGAGTQLIQAILGGSSKGSIPQSQTSLTQSQGSTNSSSEQIPPPPPLDLLEPSQVSAVAANKQYRALYDFKGDINNEELPFVVGEILDILDQEDSGWWLARNAAGQEGYIPHNYVEPI